MSIYTNYEREDMFYTIRRSNMNGQTHGPILDVFFIEEEHGRHEANKKMKKMGYHSMGHSVTPHTKDQWQKRRNELLYELQFLDFAKDKFNKPSRNQVT